MTMIKIIVENQQKKIPLNSRWIKKVAKKILEYEGVRTAALCFYFVTDPKIQSLNKRFLHHDYATDIITFDLKSSSKHPSRKLKNSKVLDGEIVISTDTALKNSRSFKTAISQEILLYIAHGI